MDYCELLQERKRIKDLISKLESETPNSERQEFSGKPLILKNPGSPLEEYTYSTGPEIIYLSTPEIEGLRKKYFELKSAIFLASGKSRVLI